MRREQNCLNHRFWCLFIDCFKLAVNLLFAIGPQDASIGPAGIAKQSIWVGNHHCVGLDHFGSENKHLKRLDASLLICCETRKTRTAQNVFVRKKKFSPIFCVLDSSRSAANPNSCDTRVLYVNAPTQVRLGFKPDSSPQPPCALSELRMHRME